MWCFFGEKKYDNGAREIVWLYHASSLPIRRHVKIKRDANPYHPAWEMYFEARESKHMTKTLAGRGTLLYLWRTQGGKCSRCGEPITKKQDGTAITSSPRCWVAQTVQPTVSFFTRNAIGNCIANSAATVPASLTRRSEGLSRVSWKLSRTVFRGAVGGNADCLLDLQRPSLPQPTPIEPGENGLFGNIDAAPKRAAKPKAGSRPVYKFEMPDGAPYALAGLYSEWRPRKGSNHPALDTFSILTTGANELTEPIHDRMPVILHPRL